MHGAHREAGAGAGFFAFGDGFEVVAVAAAAAVLEGLASEGGLEEVAAEVAVAGAAVRWLAAALRGDGAADDLALGERGWEGRGQEGHGCRHCCGGRHCGRASFAGEACMHARRPAVVAVHLCRMEGRTWARVRGVRVAVRKVHQL